jgi:pimeloyl-ACP methyl ester carboxylesterase
MSESQYASVNGVRIAYQVDGSGFPLLLLHGFPRTRRTWSRVTPALAERFTVVAPDRRGYGDSERPAPPAPYDNGTITEDHFQLMRALGYEGFLVVGHDKGAPVARRLAAEHPEAVVGAMIMDSAPQGVGPAAPRDSSGRSWYLDFFRQRDVAEQIIGQNPRLFFGLFVSRHQHLTLEEHEFYTESFARPGGTEAILADYRAGSEIDAAYWEAEAKSGRQIQVPIYAIWAERGPSANAPVLEAWRQVATDVQGEIVPNTAHYIHEEQPEATVRHILKFADYLGIP